MIEIMTPFQCARHLGIKKSTVYTWIKNRGLPFRVIGKNYRFIRSEIDDWVANQPRKMIKHSGGGKHFKRKHKA